MQRKEPWVGMQGSLEPSLRQVRIQKPQEYLRQEPHVGTLPQGKAQVKSQECETALTLGTCKELSCWGWWLFKNSLSVDDSSVKPASVTLAGHKNQPIQIYPSMEAVRTRVPIRDVSSSLGDNSELECGRETAQ